MAVRELPPRGERGRREEREGEGRKRRGKENQMGMYKYCVPYSQRSNFPAIEYDVMGTTNSPSQPSLFSFH